MKFFSIVIFIILTQCLFGQFSAIKGEISFKESNQSVSNAKVELFNSIEPNKALKTRHSSDDGNFQFDSISFGEYSLLVTRPDIIGGNKVVKILINSIDTFIFDIALKPPCIGNKSNGICIVCNSNNKVITTSPGSILSLNFANEQDAEKYYKKMRRKGYETMKTEQETLIQMYIESESDKFWDPCNNWFCKKCKVVFR
jgi:hypothetical protein